MKIKLKKTIEKDWKNILFNIMFMIISVLMVILFSKNIMLTNIILLTIAIIALIKWKSKLSVVIFIFFGLMFGIAEMVVVLFGPWNYSVWDIINIPSWLFILWGNTALFIHQIIKEIKKCGIKK